MTSIRLEELRRVVDCDNPRCSCQDVRLPVSESDLLSVLSDETLIQELAKRGVLYASKWPYSAQIGERPDFIVQIMEAQRCWRPDWRMQVPFFLAVAGIVLSTWALVAP